MAMQLVKRTPEYSIYKRGDERYAVKNAHKKAVNGDDKVAILVAEGLITLTQPSPKAEEPAAADDAAEATESAE
jgi:hypothetical protein